MISSLCWRLTAVMVLLGGLFTATAMTSAIAAQAEPNGVGTTPAMGWSSWSFLRHDPTAANIEAQAAAMASSRHGQQRTGQGRVRLRER
jgi:alpha-galactosidase